MDLHERFKGNEGNFIISSEEIPVRQESVIHQNSDLSLLNGERVVNFQFDEELTVFASGNIEFSNCVFKKKLNLENIKANVDFFSCIFLEALELASVGKGHVHYTFDNCELSRSNKLVLDSGSLELNETAIRHIQLTQNAQSFKCSGNKTKIDILTILRTKGKLDISLHYQSYIQQFVCHHEQTSLQSISAHGCEVSQLIVDCQLQTLKLSEMAVEQLTISDQRDNTTTNISDSTIQSLRIQNTEIGLTKIESSEVQKLELYNIRSSTNFILNKISKLQSLLLSDVEINHMNISEVRVVKLCLDKTNFASWELGYIDWSKRFSLFVANQTNSKKEKYLELIEVSRKLKKYFSEKGNLIDSEVFRISELSSYFKYLWSKLLSFDLSGSQIIDFLVLGSNKLFSNFGNSPLRALAFLFSVHFVLFFFLLEKNDLGYEICLNWNDCSFSEELVSFYFGLINPIHKLVDSSGKILYSTVDFAIRVSSSYFIYYFIQATRKFGRR